MRRNDSKAINAEDCRPATITKVLRGHLALILATVIVAVCVALALAVRAYTWPAAAPSAAVKPSVATHEASAVAAVQSTVISNPDLVHRGAMASQLHEAFQTLASRLERPGKERLAMTGTLQRGGGAAAFALIWELPGRVRFVEQRGTGIRVLVFDGKDVTSNDGQIDKRDLDILKLLVFDSVEHFFAAQANGTSATRFLGGRFRRDGELGGTPYDLVETTEEIGFKEAARQQTRIYYFNSDTHLLERVSYRDDSIGSETVVKLSDWRTVAGNQIAHRVELLQDDLPLLTLVIESVSVGPRVADGSFGTPR